MTTPAIEQLGGIESWDEVRARLGELAGLGGPAPSAVTRRALEDGTFAFYLLFARESPTMKQALLTDPRNAAYEDPTDEAPTADDAPRERAGRERAGHEDAARHGSASSLVGAAVKALARWGAAGFTRLDEAAYQARWQTCLACPKLTEAPDRLLYNGLTILVADNRVCSACGCVATKKAAIPTESCPLGLWPEQKRSEQRPG